MTTTDKLEQASTDQPVEIYVYEQPSLKEQAVAAAVVTGVTLVGTAALYGIGAGLLWIGQATADAIKTRKAKKAARKIEKEAPQES